MAVQGKKTHSDENIVHQRTIQSSHIQNFKGIFKLFEYILFDLGNIQQIYIDQYLKIGLQRLNIPVGHSWFAKALSRAQAKRSTLAERLRNK